MLLVTLTIDRNTTPPPGLSSIPRTILSICLLLESYRRQFAKNNFFSRSLALFPQYVYVRIARLEVYCANQVSSQVSMSPIYVVLVVAICNPLILRNRLASITNVKESLIRSKKLQLSLLISRLRYRHQSGKRRRQYRMRLLISLTLRLKKLLAPALIISSLISPLNSSSLRTTLTSLLSVSLLVVLLNQVQIVLQVLKRLLSVLSTIAPFLPYQIFLTLPLQDSLDFIFLLIPQIECFL